MTETSLAACRSESLLGYLKALGVLRLLATQVDASARGSWDGATFVIETRMSEDEIGNFFLESYAPTPILNPWNSGAGFDGKADRASETLRRVAQTIGVRWQAYRNALEFIIERYVDSGIRVRQYRLDAKDPRERDKQGFVRDLRAHCPKEFLPWLDAAILLTPDDLDYPYLFGSGGNDGHLDFSVNFAARALDVCGGQPIAEAHQLLHDALRDTVRGRLLQDVAIGQFSPRHTGGANATSGFDAVSLVNPWDYVLMMEGSLLFAGSIGRRTDRSPSRPLFPFALRGIAGGYGTASADEQVRGEMWLPVWEGRASLASIVDLLRRGRVDLPARDGRSVVSDAVLASDGATSVVTMGVPLGIRRLGRTAFAQRNGLAFSATAIGSVTVGERYDRGIAVISQSVAGWIDRVRRLSIGAAEREALRAFYDRLFAFSNIPPDGAARARARQELLIALADLDRALARTRDAEGLVMPWLQGEVIADVDDDTAAHRAAVAVASLGGGRRETTTRDELRTTGDDATQTLRGMLERRLRLAAKETDAGWLRAERTLSVDDAAAFLAFDVSERIRFNRLVRAYSHVRLGEAKSSFAGARLSGDGEPISAAYALLKLVFDNPKARDDRVLRLLFAGDAARALGLAVRRARTIKDLPAAPRDVSAVRLEEPAWWAAALALPIELSPFQYGRLLDAALVHRIPKELRQHLTFYLRCIS